tara:strand:- start:61 stop:285 length:225 start_codon:yes stop_codon:yes gene_type:complete
VAIEGKTDFVEGEIDRRSRMLRKGGCDYEHQHFDIAVLILFIIYSTVRANVELDVAQRYRSSPRKQNAVTALRF